MSGQEGGEFLEADVAVWGHPVVPIFPWKTQPGLGTPRVTPTPDPGQPCPAELTRSCPVSSGPSCCCLQPEGLAQHPREGFRQGACGRPASPSDRLRDSWPSCLHFPDLGVQPEPRAARPSSRHSTTQHPARLHEVPSSVCFLLSFSHCLVLAEMPLESVGCEPSV